VGVSSSPRVSRDLWLLALLGTALFFTLLGTRPLANPDEGRYMEIPREMIVSGDWLVPRLNGLKYFEKPPLVYWLSAMAMGALGENELAARFPCAVLALAGLLVTYAVSRSLYDRATATAAGAVLATSLLYYALSQALTLDMAITAWVTVALFAFVLAVRTPAGPRRRRLFASFYAALGLGLMTKGLIGLVLPGAVTFVWLVTFRQWRSLRPCHPIPGSLLVLAIAAPWHVRVARASPDFLWFYFVREHFLRFATRIHGRCQPWWFFAPVLLAGLFPWSVFVFQALRRTLAPGETVGQESGGHLARAWRSLRGREVDGFLLTWIAVILVFFSASQSKLVPYILPVFPPLAVLIGRYLAAAWRKPAIAGLRRGLFAFSIVAALAAVGVLLPRFDHDPTMASDLWPWQWGLAALSLIGAAGVAGLTWRRHSRAAMVFLGIWTALFLVALNPLAAQADLQSSRPLALALKEVLRPEDEVFCVGDYLQDLPVYLGRPVGVVGYVGELSFGVQAEPRRSVGRFLSTAEFVAIWAADPTRPGRRFGIGPESKVAALLARSDFPHVVLARYRGQVLFANGLPEGMENAGQREPAKNVAGQPFR
jgi:4-amino-4-deoxy-L-arabinose transferase-like glycosyltransferase